MSKSNEEMALYTRVGEGGSLSILDKKLLELAAQRKTPEEMVEDIGVGGLTPARAAQRVREILTSQDFLSELEQKRLILLDMVELRDQLWERINGGDEVITKHGELVSVSADAKHYANAIRLLTEWRKLIESMHKDVNASTVGIREAHAEIMMQAFSVMFDRFLHKLDVAGVSVPRLKAMEIMEEIMPLGFAALRERVEK